MMNEFNAIVTLRRCPVTIMATTAHPVPSCSPRKKLPGATLKHIAASSPTTGTSANITL